MAPKGSGIRVRVRGFGVADPEAVMALIDASDKADSVRSTVSGEPLLARSSDQAVRPEEHFLVAEAEGKVVAFSDLLREKGTRLVSRLWILPAWRSRKVGQQVLERRVAQAGGFDESVLDVPVRPSQHDQAALLASMGFVHVRTWWRMRADLSHNLPVPTLAPGFSFRDASAGVDAEGLTAMVNDVFSEHWGEGLHTVDEVRHDLARPEFDPQLLVLAEAMHQSVGYVWSWISRERTALLGDACAFIGDLGVTAAYRRRGLGRALLLRALNDLKAHGMQAAELEVDGPNAGALRLYKSLGFRESDELRWYRKDLRVLSHPVPSAEAPSCPEAGAGRQTHAPGRPLRRPWQPARTGGGAGRCPTARHSRHHHRRRLERGTRGG